MNESPYPRPQAGESDPGDGAGAAGAHFGRRPSAGARATLWPRGWLGQAWLAQAWRGLREMRAPGALSNLPPAYSAARRWSPLVVPVVMWAALVLLGMFLADHPMGHVTITTHHVRVLAELLLGLGVLYAVALRLAPNDAAWVGVLGLGLLLGLTASAFVLFSAGAGIVVGLVLLVGGAAFVQQRLHPVREGTVHVTALPGNGYRTLPPGVNVLLPGERVLAILPAQPREHATLPQRVTTPAGEVAEAAARVEYQLVPRLAVRAVVATRDWERAVRQLVVATLRAELGNWLAAERGARGAAQAPLDDEERLRLRVEERMSAQALRWGVHIRMVELRQVTLPGARHAAGRAGTERVVEGTLARGAGAERETPRDGERSQTGQPAAPFGSPSALTDIARSLTQALPPYLTPQAPGAAPREAEAARPSRPQSADPAPVPGQGEPVARSSRPERWLGRTEAWLRAGWARLGQRRGPPGEPQDTEREDANAREARPERGGGDASPRGDERAPEPAEQPHPLSPRMLEAMYEAVEEGRINDPYTVRQIANSFAQLAAASDPDEDATLDPLQAAATLQRQAQELAARLGLDHPEPSAGDATPGTPGGPGMSGTPPPPPQRPMPPPPRPPRDENVTRGG